MTRLLTAVCLLTLVTSVWANEKTTQISDAEIAEIVVVANRVDVEAGQLALQRSSNHDIRDLAQRMITDHTAANDAASTLAKKLKLTPRPSETSRSLEAGGQANLDRLNKLKGRAFDDAYLSHEVDYHAAVLQAIDQALLPHAQNKELISLIKAVRPVIEAHLEHARGIAARRSK